MENPKIVQKSPFVKEMKAGKYSWCSCGLSEQQPFCDGSHKGTGFVPERVEITADKKVAWCGCKHSANGAFCDGTHSKLEK
ncbi:MAG TPA: CDGSH iron-sulfur domain-containing protein [Phaeodactylibacter sp.]|nr:CDGSH iron-sulfur domain-containing protein [Phaeodactylibacter sp.]